MNFRKHISRVSDVITRVYTCTTWLQDISDPWWHYMYQNVNYEHLNCLLWLSKHHDWIKTVSSRELIITASLIWKIYMSAWVKEIESILGVFLLSRRFISFRLSKQLMNFRQSVKTTVLCLKCRKILVQNYHFFDIFCTKYEPNNSN